MFLIESNDKTLALVSAAGRRKALRAFQFGNGGVMHYSGGRAYLLDVPGVDGSVDAHEARSVGGEWLRADEVAA